MKEAIGGISIFQIVIVFILFFTGIMCLTINHSKAYGVKDEIVTIIQNKTSGTTELDSDTISKISNHLQDAGYRITGSCPNSEWIGYNREGKKVSSAASFCIKANTVSSIYNNDTKDKCKGDKCTPINEELSMVYYDVVLFYQLDIPGLNNIMNFKLYGSTKILFG